MGSERIEKKQKPKRCPVCGASPVASILYGMPAITPELKQKLKEGRITLGGCCISDDDPRWECTSCGIKIYKAGEKIVPDIDQAVKQ